MDRTVDVKVAPHMKVLPSPVPGLLGLERVPDAPGERQGLIRLNRNERLQPLPSWFIERIKERITSDLFTWYPASDILYRELAESLGVSEDCVLLTAGVEGGVKALFQAYLRRGDSVVMLDPSYAMYRVYAQMFEARTVEVGFNKQLEIDPDVLLKAVSEDVRLVMIANPNQPTGSLIGEDVMIELLRRASAMHAIVAVDEAYFPFSSYSMMPRIHEFSNLVVQRTFSKAAGLGGLGLGYTVGHPEVVSTVAKVRSTHDVNAVAIECALEIVRSPQVVEDYAAEVKAGKRSLTERLLALGLEPLPTEANFVMVRVAHRCSPEKLVEALRDRGYLVKGSFGSALFSECIRVTIGPPSLMAAFADALEEALASVVESGA